MYKREPLIEGEKVVGLFGGKIMFSKFCLKLNESEFINKFKDFKEFSSFLFVSYFVVKKEFFSLIFDISMFVESEFWENLFFM